MSVVSVMPRSGFIAAACLLVSASLQAQSPPQAKLEISAPKTTFYVGEMIPLTLSFTSSTPNSFYVDANINGMSDRLDVLDLFVVDPDEFTEDPLPVNGPHPVGVVDRGPALLSGGPFTLERTLNEWIRFRRPGVYQVHVVSKRVWPAADGVLGRPSIFDPKIILTSNVLTLEIQSTPPDWAAKQLAYAVSVLDQPVSPAFNEPRRQAARILRFLDTCEAAVELRKRKRERDSDQFLRTGHWEDREIELGVRTSPFVDCEGKLSPVP